MNAIFVAIVALGSFYMAYRFYGRFLSKKIFNLEPDLRTPAHELEDGIDYVPTDKKILWGHHFTSIAGAAPIVGPAIGVIWGWLPAVLWVILGTIFMGAVHDLGSLVISLRHRGKTIGELTENVINERSRTLFLLIMLFLVWIVPFLFIAIACGAISGFHCLVSSGTTVRQLNCESDAYMVGYGGMISEGIL